MPLASAWSPSLVAVCVVAALWEMAWKGIALWKAARRSQLTWYVLLLILNTVGILPIVYVFFVAPRQPEGGPPAPAAEQEPDAATSPAGAPGRSDR